jgi:hypothetical protein
MDAEHAYNHTKIVISFGIRELIIPPPSYHYQERLSLGRAGDEYQGCIQWIKVLDRLSETFVED